jgi:predicted TIM-barrel fold metal-dependent hydrolase
MPAVGHVLPRGRGDPLRARGPGRGCAHLQGAPAVFTGFFDKLAPFPAGSLPLARELGVAGKILLGSDFPNIPYPYARQLAGLARLGLGDDWLRRVCWDNPVAIFGPPPSAEPVGGG